MRLRLEGFETSTFGAWWIDETGAVTPTWMWGQDFDSHGFHHIGLVKIRLDPRGLELRWNLQKYPEKALERAIDWITAAQDDLPIRLSYYYFGWYTERIDKATLIDRIADTKPFADVDLGHAVKMVEQKVSQSFANLDLVGKCLELWNASEKRGRMGFGPHFQDQIVVFRPDETTGNFEYDFIGFNSPIVKVMGKSWAANAINAQKLPENYSRAYRSITNRPYENVMASGEPRYDKILASIKPPGKDPVWTSYHRLLLPMYDRKGAPIMICASEIGDINFPLLGNDATGDACHPSSSKPTSDHR